MFPYSQWLALHKEEMKDNWESMGDVEKFEEGSFKEYCMKQYGNFLSSIPRS